MEAAARRRADGDRGHRVRGARRPGGRLCAAAQGSSAAVRPVRAEGAVVRPRGGPAAVAGAGPGHGPRRAGGRRAAGGLPTARSDRGAGAVGPAQRRAHPRVRRHRGLVGGAVLQDRGHRADADRLAHRGGDRGPGMGRHREAARPVREPAPPRNRRDRLQEGAPVHHRGGRPRFRAAGVGRAGPGQGHAAAVLRRPGGQRRGTLRGHHARVRRCRGLDRRRGRRTLPERGPLCRSVPRSQMGHRGAG